MTYSRPRRILMTADTVGGVWTYALELIRALEPFNIEVILATMGALPNREQRKEVARISNLQIAESQFKLEWMESPWTDVHEAGEWLMSLERDFEPDLIHLNGFAHGILPWKAPKLVVGHSCVLSWWKAVKGERAPESWNTYQLKVSTGIRAADVVIAPSFSMLECLTEHYGPLRSYRMISNGRQASQFVPREKEPIILTAGRLWDEAKNVSAVAAIASKLPWPCYAAGEEKHPSNGPDTASKQLHLLGRLSTEDLAGWYGRASIYALPARYEPFGLSAVEAALAGCALVLGDIPSLREIWNDAALFVPPEDNDALRAAIKKLIDTPSLLHELSMKASSRARHYTPERMAEGYLAVYEELIESGANQLSLKPNA